MAYYREITFVVVIDFNISNWNWIGHTFTNKLQIRDRGTHVCKNNESLPYFTPENNKIYHSVTYASRFYFISKVFALAFENLNFYLYKGRVDAL